MWVSRNLALGNVGNFHLWYLCLTISGRDWWLNVLFLLSAKSLKNFLIIGWLITSRKSIFFHF